jgi:phospholipid transport system substrate-binding protein
MHYSQTVSRRKLIVGALATPIAMRLLGMPGPAMASPEGASAFVEKLVDEAITVLKIPLDDKTRRESGLRSLLVENFDLPLISRLVVGRHWRKANEAQKEAFRQVFEEHIVRVYTSQLGAYGDERVEMRSIVARSDKDTIVGTEIVRQSDPPLRIDWLVRETSGTYKVIDIAAEGVSMMTTKRSEFSSVIARDGMDGLISQLEQMNESGSVDVADDIG